MSTDEDVIELAHLHLIRPTRIGQKRIVQINLAIPMRIELVAVEHDGCVYWSTVSVISDASFPRPT